jgi:hypothetical protein
MASSDPSCTTCRTCSVWPDRTAPVLLAGAVPVLGGGETGACVLERGPCGRDCTCVHPCAHAGVPTGARTCAPTRVRTAVLTGVRTGRRPQRRSTSSFAVELHGSHPLLRLTFARLRGRARLTPSKTIGLHHAPVAVSMPPRSSFISPGASLVVASRRCSCCSRSRLSFVLSVPPDPCSIRSPLSSLCICLL